jgi:hypothetical protein
MAKSNGIFSLAGDDGSFTFKAASEEEAEVWVRAIGEARERAGAA